MNPKCSNRRIIGLTGGIATGKTTVSDYLATVYQLPVLDADIYAREAVVVGSPVLGAITEHFGSDILLSDGTLNRQCLGQIIFSYPDERQWLEQLIHPFVRDRFVEAIHELPAPTIVLVVPLLFEAKMTDLVTEIWVVYCSNQQQLERLMQRSKLTKQRALLPEEASERTLTQQAAQARIDSQMPIAEKCKRADVVLDNSSTKEDLLKQVDAAIEFR
ncbi:MAG: dephospho-CoA kinase [Chroococcidiopsidaceae cyanobacterium CP_BM_RX_35]|nr:dephospho-CoA kinase [Chroococcidiopsidaceae cyanobacterium CP_BM_RX_35]